jgi:hypothetical protein
MGPQNPFEDNAPTYFPSATHDTAGQVLVRPGDEVRGIDIRYRGERGRTVSGTVAPEPGASESYQMIYLVSVASGRVELTTSIPPGQAARGFAFFGVTEGEYMLTALGTINPGASAQDAFASEPQRIVVKKADVTGLTIKLTPLAAIGGSVALEQLPPGVEDQRCKAAIGRVEEMLISARRFPAQEETLIPSMNSSMSPSDTGTFDIRSLRPGRYRLAVRLLNDNQYLRNISLQKAQSAKATDLALDGFALTAGQRINDVTIGVAAGAAGLAGRVEGGRPPENLRIHLVPSEPESSNDLVRYYEAEVNSDGTFSVANVAPGRYSVVTLVSPVVRPLTDRPQPAAWEAAMRTRIRNQAKTSRNEIELKPCERVKDYVLHFAGSGSQ